MNLAIGLYAKQRSSEIESNLNKYSSLDYISNLPIGYYCYADDSVRTDQGFKKEQSYFLNGGDKIKAIRKRFEEAEDPAGNLSLTIYFDYYNWPLYNELGEFISQDIGYTKSTVKKFTGKQFFNRRKNQRQSSIDDLESLGYKLEELGNSYPSVYPQLINYSESIARIFSKFQLEIGTFIATNSSEFKDAIEFELQGDNEQLKADLNIMLPTKDELGNDILIPTHIGITSRL